MNTFVSNTILFIVTVGIVYDTGSASRNSLFDCQRASGIAVKRPAALCLVFTFPDCQTSAPGWSAHSLLKHLMTLSLFILLYKTELQIPILDFQRDDPPEVPLFQQRYGLATNLLRFVHPLASCSNPTEGL